MDFANPKLLWLALIAPIVIAVALVCWRQRHRAAAAWASRGLWDRLLPTYRSQRTTLSAILLGLAVLGLALTLAQPRWGTSQQTVERQGVDVVFVLDTSLSMATRDIQPSRLWVAQTLIRRLSQDLPGHRVALVQAEGDGVVMVPLTVDSAVLDLLLDAVQPGSLPTPGTELAPALEKAAALFSEGGEKHRVLVVLSDGENHGPALDRVAEELKDKGIVVHAIGVGTPEGKPLEMPSLDPRSGLEYKRDENGQVVVSRLMETTLEDLSRATGGVYLRATSAATEPGQIIARIDEMEKRSYGSELVSALEERFQWPATLAFLALVAHLALAPFQGPEEEGA